ncbi:MAG: glutamine ABC transporter periplasmic protein [Candidatus Methanofastidiosum methylothiophilum]|jgi:polar amino acid transport system substrate-binding protein|nr:MAG: glutamine ABC transporter periplasmic protein [Candidatus Methanofastidiosum methylthiophilus]MBP6932185.1 basic amino acid ABC transporter substrate-binding protein [Methanofastidiosum sp.]OQC52312.1 MAG: glutamine ABC transporter periplasmic protein [Euryarchaeota archaeon ADurb.Bin023]HNV93446.1 basic amino acid ABC transporter substrate-binding protein [Methanofastidiosum sp.]HNZ60700.1 basic amino acid ABC transporter substrate-binding protein [Methanofastidiosum sp.]
MKRFAQLSVVLLLILAVVAASGCTSSKSRKLVKEGYLTIGTEAEFAPFEVRLENGSFYGFDIALGEAIAKELGLKVDYIDTDFAGIILSLNSGKFDIAMSAMTITEERKKSINFSDPYFDTGLSLAVPANSPVQKLDDLNGKIVGVQLGTTGDLYASSLKNVKEVKRYPHAPDAFLDMKNGKVDAVINDDVVSKPIVAKDPNSFKIISGLLTIEQYGIAVPKDNEALLQKINAALKKIKENGTYDQIYDQYIIHYSVE